MAESEVKKVAFSKWTWLFIGVLLGATVLLAPALVIVNWVKSKIHPANAPADAQAAANQPTV